MTFSIVARCARSGEVGVGIATYSPNVGVRCPVVVPGRGAASIQAVANPMLLPIARRLLEAGCSARKVVAELQSADPYPQYRQIHVVDVSGEAAGFTGDRSPSWAGHRSGPGYSVAGNVLVGERVIDAMADAFASTPDEPLAERLVRAIEAGRDAGGQPEGQNSSALLVHGDQPFPLVDLRCDLHDAPEAELRRLWDWFRPMVPYYVERAQSPEVMRWWQWRMERVPGWRARHLEAGTPPRI